MATRVILLLSGVLVLVFFAHLARKDIRRPHPISASLMPATSPGRVPGVMGHPDIFREVYRAIRASEDGVVRYPMGYQLREYEKAVAALKSPSRQLNWVERGPGNVGGRTRPILADPDDPSQSTWIVGTAGGGLWRTADKGYRWSNLTGNLPILAISALAMAKTDHDILYIGTGEGFGNFDAISGAGIFKSYDRGQTWIHLESTATDTRFRYVNRLLVDPTDDEVVIAATNGGIYRSTDGGTTWSEALGTSRSGSPGAQDLRAQPGNREIMIAGVNREGIYYSDDAGVTWELAISEIKGGAGRIELAYAPSDPAVAYASVETVAGSPQLLRSDDGGKSWIHSLEVNEGDDGPIDWLGGQGWYNNAIAVHPFSPDTVFLGGVYLWRAVMTGDSATQSEPTAFFPWERHQYATRYIEFVVGFGTHFGGLVLVGSGDDSFTNISEADYSSIEIRFGQGTQMAHRFTADDGGRTNIDCFFVPHHENSYQDYVEVPFTVWDTDSNRQLAVSFRDQAKDGAYNLKQFNIIGSCDQVSNEQLFVHKYTYDAAAPHDSLARDGGVTDGMMYMIVPVLRAGAEWKPESLDEQTIAITYSRDSGLHARTMDGKLDPSTDTHVDHHGIVPIILSEGDSLFGIINSNDGGVYWSPDGGDSFVATDLPYHGFNTSQFYGVDKRTGISQYAGGTQDNGSLVSLGGTDHNMPWSQVPKTGDGFDALWHYSDGNKIIVTQPFNTYMRSTTRGVQWDFGYVPEPGIFMTSISSAPQDPEKVYMIGRWGVWYTESFGDSWYLTPIHAAWESTPTGKVRVSTVSSNIVWAGYGLDSDPARTLHISTDAGASFAPTSVPTIHNAPETIISGLAIHATEPSTAYALFSRYGRAKVLESNDFGHTWKDLSGFAESTDGASVRGFPDVAVFDLLVMPHAPNTMWVGTEIGVFHTRNRGKTWRYTDNGLPPVSVYRLKYRDDEIIVATHGRGIWTVPLVEVDVGVEDDHRALVPTRFQLDRNFPNPFSLSTTISFSVTKEAAVKLVLFDLNGRKVSVLADQRYAAGMHEVRWQAEGHASGVYFYRMEADGKLVGTRQMALVR